MRGKYANRKARAEQEILHKLFDTVRIPEDSEEDSPITISYTVQRKRRKSIWKHMKQNKAATLLLAAQVIPITAMVIYAAIFRTNW